MCLKLIKHFQGAFKFGHSPQNMLKLSSSTFHSWEFSQYNSNAFFLLHVAWLEAFPQTVHMLGTDSVCVGLCPSGVSSTVEKRDGGLPQGFHHLSPSNTHCLYWQCTGHITNSTAGISLKYMLKPMWERESREGREKRDAVLWISSIVSVKSFIWIIKENTWEALLQILQMVSLVW